MIFDKRNNFEQVSDNESLKKYDLKYVGTGSECVCFETAASEKKLIKVEKEQFKNFVLDIIEGSNEEDVSKKIIDFQKKQYEKYKEMESALIDVFGEEHVLKKGIFKKESEFSKKELSDIFPELKNRLEKSSIKDEFLKIKMLFYTQPIARELKSKKKYDTFSFNTILIVEGNFRANEDIEKALEKIRVSIDKHFINHIMESKKIEKYKETILEVVKGIVEYTKKTGKMMDIFGPDNLTIFTEKGGEVNFHLIDVILPMVGEHWERLQEEDEGLSLLRHYYTYFYTISTLSERLGLEDKLELDDLMYFKNKGIPSGKFPK